MLLYKQVAYSTPFDNTTNSFTATNVQAAIEESKSSSVGKARFVIICGYGGQGKGKYLAFFGGNNGKDNPLAVPMACMLKEITITYRHASIPVGSLVVYVNDIAAYTINTNGTDKQVITGLTISLAAQDEIYIFGDNNSGTTLLDPQVFLFFQVV